MVSNLIVVERSLFKGMREVLDERVEIVQVFRRGSFFGLCEWLNTPLNDFNQHIGRRFIASLCLLFIGCEVYLCMLAYIVEVLN